MSPQARNRLEAVADGKTRSDKPSKSKKTILAPGTRLLREWHGDRYEVIVEADGFRYDGKLYRSLTAVAKAITGSHISGNLFFGIQRKRGDS